MIRARGSWSGERLRKSAWASAWNAGCQRQDARGLGADLDQVADPHELRQHFDHLVGRPDAQILTEGEIELVHQRQGSDARAIGAGEWFHARILP